MVLASDGDALTGAWFDGQRHQPPHGPSWERRRDLPILLRAGGRARRVFRGRAHGVHAAAGAGRHAVPARGLERDRRHSAMARRAPIAISRPRIGRPASIRAAGAATGRNPLSIIVPCHRVAGRRWRADRVRRRARPQAGAAGARAQASRARAHPCTGARPERRQVRRSDALRLVALSAIWGSSFIFIRVIAPVLGPILTVDDARADRRRGAGRLLPDHRPRCGALAPLAPIRGDRHRQLDAAVHAVRVRRAAPSGVVFGHSQFDGAALHRAAARFRCSTSG